MYKYNAKLSINKRKNVFSYHFTNKIGYFLIKIDFY